MLFGQVRLDKMEPSQRPLTLSVDNSEACAWLELTPHNDKRTRQITSKATGNRVRTVTVPAGVKTRIDAWLEASGITKDRLFRPVSKGGELAGTEIRDEKAVWRLVMRYAKTSDLGKLAPHDLRRTSAKLCRKAGGDLEQIQLLLGHASIQTTERYLGTEQALAHAVNDAIGLDIG